MPVSNPGWPPRRHRLGYRPGPSMPWATVWPNRTPWSVWSNKGGPIRTMWPAPSVTPRARCAGSNDVSRTAAWLHWDRATATRAAGLVWRPRAGNGFRNFNPKATPTARWRDAWESPQSHPQALASLGVPRHRLGCNPNWRSTSLAPGTQTGPLLVLLRLSRPRWTPIRPIAVVIVYWLRWGCWMTRRPCLAAVRPFHAPVSCLPSHLWCAVGCFDAPKDLRQHWTVLLWPAHQSADAAAHGAVADQTARGAQGAFARRSWDACWALDRAPEVKTLRRKLTRLGRAGKGRPLRTRPGPATGRPARGQALGFLYVDGHVRVYHGKHPLPKTHVARMRLSMPATSDYWVNDAPATRCWSSPPRPTPGWSRCCPAF